MKILKKNTSWISKELTRVLRVESMALERAAQRIEQKASGWKTFEAVVLQFEKTLNRGGKVFWVGLGKSGKIAQKIAATFCSTGSPSFFLHPTEALHGDLGSLTDLDCVVGLSAGGKTHELLSLFQTLRKSQNRPILISLLGNPESPLAELSDLTLDASVEEEACPYGLAPTSSTTLALALGDAFALALMQWRGLGARDFAKNHPGGNLGKRLSLQVQDCMIRGIEHLPLVKPTTSLDEAVKVCSEKGWGAVLVHQSGVLKGLLTDGDFRRVLKEVPSAGSSSLLQTPVSQWMTRRPRVIGPTVLAQEALYEMEKRTRKISLLPVVDRDNRILGLVRVHDLLLI